MVAKITSSVLLILLISTTTFSQVTTENVNFDNYISITDNDLVNHFYGMQSLVQIPTNGITGGCLLAPDSNNWGNDNSRYCSKYSAIHIPIFTTSVSFYYDPALVSPTGFDRAASIWLQPNSDPNHYIIASVSHDKKIIIYTYYNTTNSFTGMTLRTGHWYNLTLRFNMPLTPNPFVVNYTSMVEDLGTTGTSTPVMIDSVPGSVLDTVFASDSAIEISITGSKYGGTNYLDNFMFSGVKSADSCLFSNVNQVVEFVNDIHVYSEKNTLTIKGENLKNKAFEISDIQGKKIFHSNFESDINRLDISGFPSGLFFLNVFAPNYGSVHRFTVIK